MSKKIIVIGREFGSGGHEIGERLANELGIPFYDKNLVLQASEKMGIHENEAAVDETALSDMAKGYLAHCENLLMQNKEYSQFSTENEESENFTDSMFWQQRSIVMAAAQIGACVIVGRCADYILRENPDVMSVFIHADKKTRIRRVAERSDMSEKEAKAVLRAVDKKRKKYYEQYTGWEWGDADHYQMVLNTRLITIQDTVEMLIAVYERMNKE